MATKTLSVDEEAYRRLVRARLHARESFSKVIKRAEWTEGPPRCGNLLRCATGKMSDEDLSLLEAAQREDRPPADKWAEVR
ncbi:MAG: antitoxin VapB family protein [Opitutales bacterium]